MLIVETAGAVLSPLGAGLTNLDLVRAMAPTAVVLVGLDRLGILHEVASCLLVLRSLAPQLPLPLVVLNEPSTPDASTGTNVAELIALETVGRAVVFPRMDPTAPGSACAADTALSELGL